MSSDPKQSSPPPINLSSTRPVAAGGKRRQGRGGRGSAGGYPNHDKKKGGSNTNPPVENQPIANKNQDFSADEKKKTPKNSTKSRNKQNTKKRNDTTNQEKHKKNDATKEGGSTNTKSQTQKQRRREGKSNVPKGKAAHDIKPTQQELEEMAKKKAEEERHEALLQAQKEQEERIAYLKKCQQELECDFRNRMSRIRSFVEKAVQRKNCRNDMSLQELSRTQIAFENEKKKLKSDLKKCTAFCKKIKSSQSFDDSFVASLVKDLDTLNLSRYLEEISNAFLDQSSLNRKLKVGDVNGVVKVLIALHQRYKDFMTELLVPQIIGCLRDKQDLVDPKQKRIYMRILTELLTSGVLVETKPIMKIVADAAGVVKGDGINFQEDKYTVPDPGLLLAFAKSAGFELTGIMPKSIMQDIEFIIQQEAKSKSNDLNEEGSGDKHIDMEGEGKIQEDETNCVNTQGQIKQDITVISQALLIEGKEAVEQFKSIQNERAVNDEICNRFRKHLTGAMVYLSNSLLSTHKKLFKMQVRCDQDRLLAGSLSEQREKSLKEAQSFYESLRKSVETLAEILNTDMPILEVVDEEEKKDELVLGLEVYKGEDGYETNLGPFDDEETRDFYCDIPDLLTTIPSALLGYNAEDVERIQKANSDKYGSWLGNDENKSDSIIMNEYDSNANESDLETGLDEDGIPEDKVDEEDENTENKETPHYKLMVLLEEELPECNRRDLVDNLAEKFCTNHGTNKNARKRMQQAMFLVPRSRLDLIPYYSRLAAIFDRVFPEISSSLVTELEKQFHGLARWKKQQGIDSRIRNAKFIAELTKFNVAPPIVVICCLQRCVQDFSGHNIDVACCILESCGRFLHRSKHTAPKLSEIMENITRIRKAKHFDERTIELIKSAFFTVQPPKLQSQKKVKSLTDTEEYLKHLIIDRLDKSNVSFVSKQILRFPWNDASHDYSELVVKYLVKACRKGRFNSITAVASLAAKMRRHRPEIIARLIDLLLEELHFIIEHPSVRDQQRAIVYTKLIGELHSNGLISLETIFDQLHKFINFDHDIPDSLRAISSEQSLDKESPMPSSLRSELGINKAIHEDEEMEVEDGENAEDTNAKSSPAPMAVSKLSKYDPRVFSALDPPSSVFRIKLVCTLLDSCVSSLVTVSSFSKLECFLATFQRYIFIKTAVPADIEFSLLDTFDLLDSTLKSMRKSIKGKASIMRYKSWFEAHDAIVKDEESEAKAKEKARDRLLSQAGILSGGDAFLDEQDDFDEKSTGDISNDDSTDDSDNDSNSVSDETMSECEEDSGEDDSECDAVDNLIDEEGVDDFEDSDILRKLEDEAFERELRKLTMEAVEKGKHSARIMAASKVSDSMPSASQFSRSRNIHSADGLADNPTVPTTLSLSGTSGMNFTFIKRGRKGRTESKPLIVPIETNLVKVATTQDTEAAIERDLLKARVLRYEAESAEMSSGDVYMSQEQVPEVRNRSLRNIDIDKQFGRSRPFSGRGLARGRGNHGGRGLKRF